jgi:hypothetical protein
LAAYLHRGNKNITLTHIYNDLVENTFAKTADANIGLRKEMSRALEITVSIHIKNL